MRQLLYKLTHPFFRLYWKIFKPKTSGTKALLIHDQNILLVKNINVTKWSLPGGQIDKKETPESCVERELSEELGLENVHISHKLGVYTSTRQSKQDTVHVFVINLLSPSFTKKWELQAAGWFSLDSLPEDISPATDRRIAEYEQGKRDLTDFW